ncbi:MAG: hypothetical protein JNK82_38800 [Myxococcaceae bacterium]|nr:hypothetical protein [Myxococcaceae bacterium]
MRRSMMAMLVVLACGEAPCDVPNTADLQPGEQTGPAMRPGSNCLRCHTTGGRAASAPFSIGGTVYESHDAEVCGGVGGVTVRVTDANGKRVSVVTNDVGNFWSTEPLVAPYSLEVERAGRVAAMPVTTPTGGCALCHSWPDPVSAIGRIRAP